MTSPLGPQSHPPQHHFNHTVPRLADAELDSRQGLGKGLHLTSRQSLLGQTKPVPTARQAMGVEWVISDTLEANKCSENLVNAVSFQVRWCSPKGIFPGMPSWGWAGLEPSPSLVSPAGSNPILPLPSYSHPQVAAEQPQSPVGINQAPTSWERGCYDPSQP